MGSKKVQPFREEKPNATTNCLLQTGNFGLNQNFQKHLSQSKTWKEVLWKKKWEVIALVCSSEESNSQTYLHHFFILFIVGNRLLISISWRNTFRCVTLNSWKRYGFQITCSSNLPWNETNLFTKEVVVLFRQWKLLKIIVRHKWHTLVDIKIYQNCYLPALARNNTSLFTRVVVVWFRR